MERSAVVGADSADDAAGGRHVSDIYVDAATRSRCGPLLPDVGGGRVFRSDDGGTTWTDRIAGLPRPSDQRGRSRRRERHRVWVAADLGVYQSLDAGAHWTDFSTACPTAYVGDLVFHPHARVLRAGTRNRGVWEIPVDGWMTQPVCGMQWNGTLRRQPDAALVHVQLAGDVAHDLDGDADDAARAPQVTWTVEVERARRSSHLLDHGPEPDERRREFRRTIRHSEPLLVFRL